MTLPFSSSQSPTTIKSLVVDPKQRGRGLGRIVVEALLDEARAMSLRTVFALTTTPVFFETLGFHQAAVSAFPRKVWNECLRCPKYDHCDEVALAIDLGNPAAEDAVSAGDAPTADD